MRQHGFADFKVGLVTAIGGVVVTTLAVTATLTTGGCCALMLALAAVPITIQVIYNQRFEATKRAIIKQRLCLQCGYSLRGTDCDETGVGACPECGELFAEELYTFHSKLSLRSPAE